MNRKTILLTALTAVLAATPLAAQTPTAMPAQPTA